MCAAAIALFVIGGLAARSDIARARGLDKIVAFANLCFAAPLAVFGAEHFGLTSTIRQLVPKYMPGPLFWTYFVGLALIAASLSIATKIQVQWSGLFFGIMMFLFVAMMDLSAIPANLHNRIFWVLFCREPSFGVGGWMLAAAAMNQRRGESGRAFPTIGRVVIGIAAVFYGIEHFLHPTNVPGIPLEKFMPEWIPARVEISYLTGVILVAAGAFIVSGKKVRTAARFLGTWILLLVVFIYGPILIASLMDPSTDAQVEGLNYFFDTLLYAGTILALANAFAENVIKREQPEARQEQTEPRVVHSPAG